MDKKTERKWRMRQFRLRSAIFLKRNGIFLAALLCLAAVGVAALISFTGENKTPVHRNDDERLADVSASPAAGTAAPSPAPKPTPGDTASETPAVVSPSPAISAVPDFTFAPEDTPDPALSMLEPPVDGSVIRIFAVNSLIWSETLSQWMTHPGVDIAANKGDPVYAVLGGTVERVYTDDMLGVTVIIGHENGLKSVYSGLKEAPPVDEGDGVLARQIVGYVGDTAIGECAERSHLHFELRTENGAIDPESMIIFNKQ